MFGWGKKKGQSIEERLAALEESLIQEKQENYELVTELEKVNEELESANEELAVHREQLSKFDDKRNSPEPWIEVIGDSIDPVRGLILKLDWNDAFIQYLKENGITGQDEDTAVQKYLALLYQDQAEKVENKVYEKSDVKVSDYI